MKINLNPELKNIIQSQLETRQFKNPEEVLEAALKLLVKTQAEQSRNNQKSDNPWDTLEVLAGTVEAPADWSSEHNHYLYGTPKQYLNYE